jgi:nitroreductase
MNMSDIIYSRKSIRRFYQEKIDWEVIEEILQFANNLPMLVSGIKVEFKLVSNIETNQGFNGPFAIKAPYYICLSSEKTEDYLLNAGYIMQQLSLYIESKELGTCYLGAASPGFGLKSTMKFDYVIALAFGKSKEPLYRDSDSSLAKRLPENDLVVYKEEVSSDIHKLLEVARLAPSSYNNQPWRFVVYKNRIHIFTKKNPWFAKPLEKLKMLDMGIMLANMMIAAEELWIEVKLTKAEAIKNKVLPKNEYVLTALIDG